MTRSLHIFSNGVHVGQLQEENNLWQLAYSEGWLASPQAFALSPDLPLSDQPYVDGASSRPVQWFFDNLLPEEDLRKQVANEAGIRAVEDSFALLEYLGKESSGALTLLPEATPPQVISTLEPLTAETLSSRVEKLPRHTLVQHQMKRMSLAGAQHKMLLVLKGPSTDRMFEPVGATASTHILKPDHPNIGTYPGTVVNEWSMMSLARAVKLKVPDVSLLRVPEPVYVVERFDRLFDKNALSSSPGSEAVPVQRLHVLDGCQMLGLSSISKYSSATLATLVRLIDLTTNKALARVALFQWLLFNIVIGNNDCHLKNLSFTVTGKEIAVAPHYDLLSTVVYETTALAEDVQRPWDLSPMTFALPGAATFAAVKRDALIAGANVLGIPKSVAERAINSMRDHMLKAVPRILDPESAALKSDVQGQRVIRSIRHIVIAEMLPRLG